MKFEEKYNLKPILMKTNQVIATQDESKQTWTKPELELVSIKEQTLGAAGVVSDGIMGS